MNILKFIAVAVVSYLLGNISVGVIISKAFGIWDIRKHGSGNSGSTNVLRTLGWLPGVLTLVGDCLKGYLSCLFGRWLGGDPGMLLGGLCAILGHDYPVFMGFRGGKGIATSLGLIIALDPWLALAFVVVVVVIVAITRYMSVGSIIASIAFPVTVAILFRGRAHYPLFVAAAVLAGLLSIYRHKDNIKRLLRHEENRLDFERISKISEKVMKRMRDKKNKHHS
ncbi:MAG: glycerol-3-phosphate 1-O-acyltransferase PlsY [Clostridia bacterium]|nr:glycerol-3-phosphate 1-O-acyltransferase PlsY [Clostridia bacterium]